MKNMKKIKKILPVFCLFISIQTFAQTSSDETPPNEEAAPVPSVYRAFSLGMGLDELKDALAQDALFNFQESDVSFVPSRTENYVATTGFSFIRRALFQIKDEKVFVMSFTMDAARVDYYSMYMTLVRKYGEPKILDPKQAVWEDEKTRLTLERPLLVQYIDKEAFSRALDEAVAARNEELEMRAEFLNEF
ncbi:MAG: hypothetical protein LBE74_03405 [Treponema sp.]|jgi:hypothetical protein|nr:hypothetical protein [Treponema sp.]